MPSKYNTNLIKTRRSYTPQEIAGLLHINKRTCFRWIEDGLSPIESNTNPLLIMGHDLINFLKTNQEKRKVKLKSSNDYYCVKCRIAVRAKKGTEKIIKMNKKIGKDNKDQYKKYALCEKCQTQVHRFLGVSQKD